MTLARNDQIRLLELLQEQERRKLRKKLQNSFFEFLKYFWDVIIAEEPVYNWHIEELCNINQAVYQRVFERLPKLHDVEINIPPGTTKTTVCTIAAPPWGWCNDPTLRFLTGSHGVDLATKHALKSRDIIRSEKYKWLFPEIVLKKDNDGKTNYANTLGGSRAICSPTKSSIGDHAHIHIMDDIQTPLKVLSDADLFTTNNFLSQELSGRKTDKEITVQIKIGQRLGERDSTAFTLSQGLPLQHICLPGELSEDVNPPELKEKYVDGLLDPVRLNRSILKTLKTQLGSYGYAGQIMQRPAPAEGGILKKAWFEIISWDQFRQKTNNSVTWNFLVDGAYTKNNDNDPCGLMSYCVHRYTIYIRNVTTQRLEQPQLLTTLETYVHEYGYTSRSIAKMEPKANGISTVQMMKEYTPINFTEYKYPKTAKVTQNDPKETRVRAASVPVEAMRVKLIQGMWNEAFIDECAAFPNAKHDECPDLLQMAVLETVLERKPGKMRRH